MSINYFKRILSKNCTKFARLKGAPRKIALGFSLGLFIGMTPFIGVHIITGVILASFLRLNKLAAILGVNITNVGTAPFIYPLNYWVGVKLAGVSSDVSWSFSPKSFDLMDLFSQSPLILADLAIGGVVIGIPLAVMGYFLAFRTIQYFRNKNTSFRDKLVNEELMSSKTS